MKVVSARFARVNRAELFSSPTHLPGGNIRLDAKATIAHARLDREVPEQLIEGPLLRALFDGGGRG